MTIPPGTFRLLPVAILSLLLAACLSVKTPILDPGNSDPLPGGPGRFKAVSEEEKEQGEITVRASGKKYSIVGLEKGKERSFEAVLKRLDGDRYIIQVQDDGPKDGILVLPLVITPERITSLKIDNDDVAAIAERQGLVLVRKRLFGDNSQANRRIEEAEAGNKGVLIRNFLGLEIRAGREQALAFAKAITLSKKTKPHGPHFERLK